ncbi:MAG: ABC transporter ATP-binding protein [Rhodospirillales bacterium]|nr:ABC transporter ATP-binding protein [Rhodospirillales bacterium]
MNPADALHDGLVLAAVGHAYGGQKVVAEVSLAVAPGELVCLLGPSGCGKTTTLRIAAGLEHPQEGSVRLGGRVVADAQQRLPPEERHVGFLFQDYALFPHLDVAHNIAFGLAGRPKAEIDQRVRAVLAQVGMDGAEAQYPHTLSGGQQQRVALARALAPNPRLMLLDEPFSGLDSRLRDQVRDQTLHILKTSGVATLMVTHDPEEAMFMADRIALMREGRIVQVGPPEELYFRPADAFVAAFFGEVNRLAGIVQGGKVATALGAFAAPGLAEGAQALVLIRPEAVRLASEEVEGAALARVLAARLLGRASLVHLAVGEPERLHLHARIPGRFLPAEGERLAVRLDPAQVFVFPA